MATVHTRVAALAPIPKAQRHPCLTSWLASICVLLLFIATERRRAKMSNSGMAAVVVGAGGGEPGARAVPGARWRERVAGPARGPLSRAQCHDCPRSHKVRRRRLHVHARSHHVRATRHGSFNLLGGGLLGGLALARSRWVRRLLRCGHLPTRMGWAHRPTTCRCLCTRRRGRALGACARPTRQALAAAAPSPHVADSTIKCVHTRGPPLPVSTLPDLLRASALPKARPALHHEQV